MPGLSHSVVGLDLEYSRVILCFMYIQGSFHVTICIRKRKERVLSGNLVIHVRDMPLSLLCCSVASLPHVHCLLISAPVYERGVWCSTMLSSKRLRIDNR